MADKKISQLNNATTPLAGTEVLPIVQSGSTVKVSVANLTAGRTVDATTVNATTVDATNVEVTNVKAKDGTAAITLADSTGAATFAANPVLNGGAVNGVLFLDASKTVASGSRLTFDGNNFSLSAPNPAVSLLVDTTNTGVSANNYSEIQLADTGAVRTYWRNMRDGSGATIFSGNDHLRLAIGGAERARLTAGGYFKASNAGTYFGVSGSYHELRQTANDVCLIATNTDANFSSTVLYLDTARAANAGFNLASWRANGATQFEVSGAGVIYAQNTTVQSLSDGRLKENVRDASEGLNVINALRPVRYDWKEGYGNDRKNQLGFIAQEMETVFPEAVGEWKARDDEEAYKTVGPAALIPVLVKAIQEQQAMIDELKAKVAALGS